MATKKVKRKKLNIKALIILLLIIYLIVMVLYTFFNMPIKNIYIKNTNILSDNEIIEAAGIKNYPSIFKLSTNVLERKISNVELVSSVKVKKTFTGKLIIEVEEAIPLFYNRNNEQVVFSNGANVEKSKKYLGIPTLINYVPTDILKDFREAFKEIDPDIIKMINEIEYAPDINGDIVIDDNRFLLRMNDTNHVYINVLNMKRLNSYKEIYAAIYSSKGDKHGTVLLDSYVSDNNLIGLFEEF